MKNSTCPLQHHIKQHIRAFSLRFHTSLSTFFRFSESLSFQLKDKCFSLCFAEKNDEIALEKIFFLFFRATYNNNSTTMVMAHSPLRTPKSTEKHHFVHKHRRGKAAAMQQVGDCDVVVGLCLCVCLFLIPFMSRTWNRRAQKHTHFLDNFAVGRLDVGFKLLNSSTRLALIAFG